MICSPLRIQWKNKLTVESRGSIVMPIKAKTSPEEKVQIVEACLGGEIGQKSAAIKLGVNKAPFGDPSRTRTGHCSRERAVS